MNVAHTLRFVTTRLALASVAFAVPVAHIASQPPVAVARLVADPARITIRAGESQPYTITAYDAQGRVLADAPVRVGGPRAAVAFSNGQVRAFKAGSYTAVATAAGATGPITLDIPVLITWPALAKLVIIADTGRLYTGITIAHRANGSHADGSPRIGMPVTWRSSDATVATVDRFGNVTALRAGAVSISADAEGLRATQRYVITPNPVATVAIGIKDDVINTGDVIRLVATAKNAAGAPVKGAVLTWSYTYTPDDTTVAPGGPGIIDWGRFTANAPGQFTLLVSSGSATARKVIEVKPRDVVRRITVTGRGSVNTTHTSDLWPWTGKEVATTAWWEHGVAMATP